MTYCIKFLFESFGRYTITLEVMNDILTRYYPCQSIGRLYKDALLYPYGSCALLL